ncbi:ribonuclease 3-like [Canna indica]|uniref:Ribonuclease 3-like n=1 Tax=Canna indica TaxID=4628 RepID=A0AAQ3QA83_9LILI|nr:ribonuclease 3-like [Canna indica]
MGVPKALPKALPRLCLLGLLLCASSMLASSTADFLYINFLWPGTRCQKGFLGAKTCCVNDEIPYLPAADFLIDGVETYDSVTGKPVTNCTSKCKFNVNALVSFISDLYQYWPTLTCPAPVDSNLKLQWQNTWCTYGYCSGLPVQTDFFNVTLRYREKVNLLNTLAVQGITPSDSKTYKLSAIQAALDAVLMSSSTIVECQRNYIAWPLIYEDLLIRIQLCTSVDGKSIIRCPLNVKSNCSSSVKFPKFSYDMIDGVESGNPIKLPSEDMTICMSHQVVRTFVAAWSKAPDFKVVINKNACYLIRSEVVFVPEVFSSIRLMVDHDGVGMGLVAILCGASSNPKVVGQIGYGETTTPALMPSVIRQGRIIAVEEGHFGGALEPDFAALGCAGLITLDLGVKKKK